MNKKISYLPVLIIFGLTFFLYSNTLNHDFVMDDAIVYTKNVFVQNGLMGIKDIFTHDTFEGFFQHENTSIAGGRYRPLSLVSFAIEKHFFGKNAFIGHLGNVLFFGICCLLIYFLLVDLSVSAIHESGFFSLPFLSAVIFAVHPIHTEVVANIKGRDEILAMIGSLSVAIFSLKFYDTKKYFWLIFIFIFFFFALLSKENSITFLVIIPLMIYFFRERKTKLLVLTIIPLVLASVIYLLLRSAFTTSLLGEEPNEILNNAFLHASLSQKFATIVFCFGKYLQLLFFPYELTHDYYFNQIPLKEWTNPGVLFSLMLLFIMLAIIIYGLRKKWLPAFVFIYFFCTIVIVLNIFFPVGVLLSERFLFMPSLGFCMGIAYFLLQVTKKLSFGIIAVLMVLGSTKTISRNKVWKDGFSLFSNDVRISSNSTKAHFDLAAESITLAILEKDSLIKESLISIALNESKKALEIYPQYAFAWLISGMANYHDKNYFLSVEHFEKAISLNPSLIKNESAIISLAYYQLGIYYGKQKIIPDSSVYFMKKSININSLNPNVFQDLGVVYGMKNEIDSSLYYFSQALLLSPSDKKLMLNIALVYSAKGDTAKANEYFRAASKNTQ